MERLERLKEASGGRVLVGVSGKDSLAVLDLLHAHGIQPVPYHLYIVPGCEYRERVLRWVERRYGVEVIRWPHPDLSLTIRTGLYRAPLPNFPALGFTEVFDALRQEARVAWIATGEKMVDSLQRRGMMHRFRPHYMDEARRVAWPIADWNDRQVYAYLRRRRIPLPPEYAALGRGFGGSPLEREGMRWLRRYWPRDFRRYRLFYPAIEAAAHEEAQPV